MISSELLQKYKADIRQAEKETGIKFRTCFESAENELGEFESFGDCVCETDLV